MDRTFWDYKKRRMEASNISSKMKHNGINRSQLIHKGKFRLAGFKKRKPKTKKANLSYKVETNKNMFGIKTEDLLQNPPS